VNTQPAAPTTGTPLFTVDSPGVNRRILPWLAVQANAKATLYYNTTQNLPSALIKDGLFVFGGQGDGTLFYFSGSEPIASMRLKQWERGLQDAVYLTWAKESGISLTPITRSMKDWPRDEAILEAERIRIGNLLNLK
jgi:hypothetical protein